MPINQDYFDTDPPSRDKKLAFEECLQDFTRNLEKYFFSQISIRVSSSSNHQVNLVIELNCGLSLREMIRHYENESWGYFSQRKFSLEQEIEKMQIKSNHRICIEEFSIFLEDTAIIIDRLYNYNISEQLINVFDQLGTHHKQYSKGYTEIPYEIFIAVFEDDSSKGFIAQSNIKNANLDQSNYWALYFESEEDAVIYDLKQTIILYEDLQMLNE